MKLASLLLQKAGHEVLRAVDAETGLTLARAQAPALILMDVQLPGMDGLAAAALLKGDPATAGIPIIALTAMAMKEDREKARRLGASDYILKPTSTVRLLDIARELHARWLASATDATATSAA